MVNWRCSTSLFFIIRREVSRKLLGRGRLVLKGSNVWSDWFYKGFKVDLVECIEKVL